MKIIRLQAGRPEKTSKGYRLRPSTHNLIRKMQQQLNSTQDKVISSALKLYYHQLKK